MDNKEEKFRKIIADNKERLKRICKYYAPSPEDQKDIYQEILINIWRSLESFRNQASIGTWIYRIAVDTSLDYAGKSYKKMKLNVDIEKTDLKNLLIEGENDPELEEHHYQELRIHLNNLGIIDKAIMGLVLDDLSTREIAEIIGITESNVRVKIHRIKETLKSNMKGEKYEN